MFVLANCAVFFASFLLFQVELVVSKAVLPGFGGSYLVWAACVMFFQAALLAGYGWAYFLASRSDSRFWPALHALFCIAPLALFPVDPAILARPSYGLAHVLDISWMLLRTVGPGFLVLAAMGLATQQRVALSGLGRRVNAYVLYATSNLGSFAGLVTYPFVVEPLVGVGAQFAIWQYGFGAAVVVHLVVYFGCPSQRWEASPESTKLDGRTPWKQRLTWLVLSASGAAMFLSVTNAVTMDLAAVPLLWTVPLALYLLTFTLAFRTRPWCPQAVRDRFPLAAAVGYFLFLLIQQSYSMPVLVMGIAHGAVLLLVCTVCHTVLYESRPADPGRLASFYMHIALGGFLGGMLVSWGAPLAGASLVEYPAAIVLAGIGLALSVWSRGGDPLGTMRSVGARMVGAFVLALAWPAALDAFDSVDTSLIAGAGGLLLALLLYKLDRRSAAVALIGVAVILAVQARDLYGPAGGYLMRLRNFYGIYKVYDEDGTRYLRHGTTLHGMQHLAPDRRAVPLAYYHPTTPVGALFEQGAATLQPLIRKAPVAIVGLGAGSLTSYAKPGQAWDIFELDPDNLGVARQYFSYLEQSAGELRFIFGDARLSLQSEPDGAYGVLIVDAFNSDSIPVHLLTREALAEYFRCLAADGVIALHLSNKYLDLVPIVQATAVELGSRVLVNAYVDNVHPDARACVWGALTRNAASRDALARMGWKDITGFSPQVQPWTDDYSNIFSALR
ncbi:MAG: fused MFS/spermidine synthase [Oceanidesulfovibrio sp.]